MDAEFFLSDDQEIVLEGNAIQEFCDLLTKLIWHGDAGPVNNYSNMRSAKRIRAVKDPEAEGHFGRQFFCEF